MAHVFEAAGHGAVFLNFDVESFGETGGIGLPGHIGSAMASGFHGSRQALAPAWALVKRGCDQSLQCWRRDDFALVQDRNGS